MIVKTLRDVLAVYDNCEKAELCLKQSYVDEYFYRTEFKYTPSMVLNTANRENTVFYSFCNKKWVPHQFRAVTFINTKADVVKIPVYLIFSLVESMFNKHNIVPPVRVRSRQYLETHVHKDDLISIMHDFGSIEPPTIYHCVSIGRQATSVEESDETMFKIEKSYQQDVLIRGPVESGLGQAFIVAPRNESEPIELSMNRLKISTALGSDDIQWLICIEPNISMIGFKQVIDTLLQYLPDEFLDERLI